MSDKPAEKAALMAVRCADCGAAFREFAWQPGSFCPKCGSRDFAPVVVGESRDYATADRTAAFAREDVRFGRLAVWAGWLNPKQLQRALHQQSFLAKSGKAVPDLGSLLVKENALARTHAQAVLTGRRMAGTKEDEDFGKNALRSGYITQAQFDECMALQAESAKDGSEAVPLPLLMYEKRYLQENQVMALLKAQEREQAGLLYAMSQALQHRQAKGIDMLIGVKGSKTRPVRIAGIVFVALTIAFWIVRGLAVPAPWVNVVCTNCQTPRGAPSDSPFPIECPACHKKALVPMMICMDCAQTFALTKSRDYLTCPNCNSSNVRDFLITMKQEEIAKQAEEKKRLKGN